MASIDLLINEHIESIAYNQTKEKKERKKSKKAVKIETDPRCKVLSTEEESIGSTAQ